MLKESSQVSSEILHVDKHRILFHVQVVSPQKSFNERLVQGGDSCVQVVRHYLQLCNIQLCEEYSGQSTSVFSQLYTDLKKCETKSLLNKG